MLPLFSLVKWRDKFKGILWKWRASCCFSTSFLCVQVQEKYSYSKSWASYHSLSGLVVCEVPLPWVTDLTLHINNRGRLATQTFLILYKKKKKMACCKADFWIHKAASARTPVDRLDSGESWHPKKRLNVKQAVASHAHNRSCHMSDEHCVKTMSHSGLA